MEKIVAFPFRHHKELFYKEARDLLENAGYKLVCNDAGKKLSREDHLAMIQDAFAIVAGTESYDADMIRRCKNLKLVMRFGVGTDNFDLNAMKQQNVQVGVIANYNAVAEFALMLMLSVLKQLPRLDNVVRNGGWTRYEAHELSGKTIGLIGFGRIGRRLAELLQNFDVKIIAYDPYMDMDAANQRNVESVTLEDLFTHADIISLHLPSLPETYHLINADTISRMKTGSYIINTARGKLIDEIALCDALKCRKLAGAGLDVYEEEPFKPGNPLCELNNVVLTPHTSALTYETNYKASLICAKSILQVERGGKPIYPVI